MSTRRDFITNTHATSYDFISPLNLDLTGRKALVTGAAWSNGVGFATAMAFVRAGVSAIAVVDLHGVSEILVKKLRTAASEAGRSEPMIIRYTADISKGQSVQDLHTAVSEAFGGRLDILVNNAAHQEPYGGLLDSDPAVEWRTWEVNVRGLHNMTRSFLPLLQSSRSDGGLCTIVNVASSGALSARAGSANYRSSKLAILRWTEILQLDYQDSGLLAYCVNPGAIKTEMTINEPEAVRARLPHQPDIAGDTIAWLSSERREWLGGRYVSCPWDMRELMDRKAEIVEGDKLKMRMVF